MSMHLQDDIRPLHSCIVVHNGYLGL